MARKDRFNDQPFTCSNKRFNTNIERGEPHGMTSVRGSVFGHPLVTSEGYSLWLEHVIDRKLGREAFWLMWYDPDGSPTIPASGVISTEQLREMSKGLQEFIGIP